MRCGAALGWLQSMAEQSQDTMALATTIHATIHVPGLACIWAFKDKCATVQRAACMWRAPGPNTRQALPCAYAVGFAVNFLWVRQIGFFTLGRRASRPESRASPYVGDGLGRMAAPSRLGLPHPLSFMCLRLHHTCCARARRRSKLCVAFWRLWLAPACTAYVCPFFHLMSCIRATAWHGTPGRSLAP